MTIVRLSDHRKPTSPAPTSPRRFPWRPILVVALLAVAFGYWAAPSQPGKLPPAVTQRPGLVWNNSEVPGVIPLQIVPGADQSHFINLVQRASSEEVLSLYVQAGKTQTVLVPPGTYRLKIASGETWRGTAALFGPGPLTRFEISDEVLEFSAENGVRNGMTVTMGKSADGNFATSALSAAAF